MSNPIYKTIGSPAMRIIEECGEIIQAVMKGERFGWCSHHPDYPNINNLQRLKFEIEDVLAAFDDLNVDIDNQAR